MLQTCVRRIQDRNAEFFEQGRSYRSERLVDPLVDFGETVQLDTEFKPFENHASLEVQRDHLSSQRSHLNTHADREGFDSQLSFSHMLHRYDIDVTV